MDSPQADQFIYSNEYMQLFEIMQIRVAGRTQQKLYRMQIADVTADGQSGTKGMNIVGARVIRISTFVEHFVDLYSIICVCIHF